jgi:ankyrin repeat protein
MKRILVFFLWLLLNFGSEPFAPIANAAREGDVAEIRALAAKGADPNERAGVNNWTPLMHAVHKNQIASVEALLDVHANPNVAAPTGETPLMMAAGYGYTPIVRLLLARGANPRQVDKRGESALDWALTGTNDIDDFTLFHCQDETARVLIAAHAKAKPSSVRFARLKGCHPERR